MALPSPPYLAFTAHLIALTKPLLLGGAQRVPGHDVVTQGHMHAPAGLDLACERSDKNFAMAENGRYNKIIQAWKQPVPDALRDKGTQDTTGMIHMVKLIRSSGQMKIPMSCSSQNKKLFPVQFTSLQSAEQLSTCLSPHRRCWLKFHRDASNC